MKYRGQNLDVNFIINFENSLVKYIFLNLVLVYYSFYLNFILFNYLM